MTSINQFYPDLKKLIDELLNEQTLITEARKVELRRLADYIRQDGKRRLNFICTHNSRRSHLAMIWAAVAADFFRLPQVETFSGGTEATAMNPRIVAALERAGFRIEVNSNGNNPHYRIVYGAVRPPIICYSKVYDDPVNPPDNFGAILVCSSADADCPIVAGADFRLSLPYDDPKVADNRPAEVQTYDERLREIGREILYTFELCANF